MESLTKPNLSLEQNLMANLKIKGSSLKKTETFESRSKDKKVSFHERQNAIKLNFNKFVRSDEQLMNESLEQLVKSPVKHSSHHEKMSDYRKKVYESIGNSVNENQNQVKPSSEEKFKSLIENIFKAEDNSTAINTWRHLFQRIFDRAKTNPNSFEPEFLRLAFIMNSIETVSKNNFHITESLFNAKSIGNIASDGRIVESRSKVLESKFIENKLLSRIEGDHNSQIIMPNSQSRKMWDLIIIILIIVNLIQIPLIFLEKHGLDETSFYFDVLNFIVDDFFFIDIILNFLTGYVTNRNNIVVDVKRIRLNYLTSFFIFDLLCVFPFEIFFSRTTMNLLKLAKINRLLRLSKIFKFIKNHKQINLIRLATVIVIFVLFVHWLGSLSILYLLKSHIFKFLVEEERNVCFFKNSFGQTSFSLACQYNLAAFYGFSFVLSEDIEFYNYSFNIFLLATLITTHVFVSISYSFISTYLLSISKADDDQLKRDIILSYFFKKSKIESDLKEEITVALIFKNEKFNTQTNFEKIKECLTDTIKEKFLANAYTQAIRHLTFLNSRKIDDKVLGTFLTKLERFVYSNGDIVYSIGEVTKGMWLLTKGQLKFLQDENNTLDYFLPEKETKEDWFSLENSEIISILLKRTTK